MENQKRKSTWSTILKVIIAVATAIGSVIGIQSCISTHGKELILIIIWLFLLPSRGGNLISRPAATTHIHHLHLLISVTISASRVTADPSWTLGLSGIERTARTTTGILSASVMKGACLPAAYPRTHGHWNRKRPCWPCSGSCGLSCPKQSL